MGPSENLLADWTWVLRERRTQSMTPTCLPLTPGQWASPTSVGNAGVGRGRGAGPGPPGGDSSRRRACGARRLQGWAPGAGAAQGASWTDVGGGRACGRAGPRVDQTRETHHAGRGHRTNDHADDDNAAVRLSDAQSPDAALPVECVEYAGAEEAGRQERTRLFQGARVAGGTGQ